MSQENDTAFEVTREETKEEEMDCFEARPNVGDEGSMEWNSGVIGNTSRSTDIASKPELLVGDLVWAKLPGHAWWPSMVSYEPKKAVYFESLGKGKTRFKYHVQFFGDEPQRGWVSDKSMIKFQGKDSFVRISNSRASNKVPHSKQLGAWTRALAQAEKALPLNRQQRKLCYVFKYSDEPVNQKGAKKLSDIKKKSPKKKASPKHRVTRRFSGLDKVVPSLDFGKEPEDGNKGSSLDIKAGNSTESTASLRSKRSSVSLEDMNCNLLSKAPKDFLSMEKTSNPVKPIAKLKPKQAATKKSIPKTSCLIGDLDSDMTYKLAKEVKIKFTKKGVYNRKRQNELSKEDVLDSKRIKLEVIDTKPIFGISQKKILKNKQTQTPEKPRKGLSKASNRKGKNEKKTVVRNLAATNQKKAISKKSQAQKGHAKTSVKVGLKKTDKLLKQAGKMVKTSKNSQQKTLKSLPVNKKSSKLLKVGKIKTVAKIGASKQKACKSAKLAKVLPKSSKKNGTKSDGAKNQTVKDTSVPKLKADKKPRKSKSSPTDSSIASLDFNQVEKAKTKKSGLKKPKPALKLKIKGVKKLTDATKLKNSKAEENISKVNFKSSSAEKLESSQKSPDRTVSKKSRKNVIDLITCRTIPVPEVEDVLSDCGSKTNKKGRKVLKNRRDLISFIDFEADIPISVTWNRFNNATKDNSKFSRVELVPCKQNHQKEQSMKGKHHLKKGVVKSKTATKKSSLHAGKKKAGKKIAAKKLSRKKNPWGGSHIAERDLTSSDDRTFSMNGDVIDDQLEIEPEDCVSNNCEGKEDSLKPCKETEEAEALFSNEQSVDSNKLQNLDPLSDILPTSGLDVEQLYLVDESQMQVHASKTAGDCLVSDANKEPESVFESRTESEEIDSTRVEMSYNEIDGKVVLDDGQDPSIKPPARSPSEIDSALFEQSCPSIDCLPNQFENSVDDRHQINDAIGPLPIAKAACQSFGLLNEKTPCSPLNAPLQPTSKTLKVQTENNDIQKSFTSSPTKGSHHTSRDFANVDDASIANHIIMGRDENIHESLPCRITMDDTYMSSCNEILQTESGQNLNDLLSSNNHSKISQYNTASFSGDFCSDSDCKEDLIVGETESRQSLIGETTEFNKSVDSSVLKTFSPAPEKAGSMTPADTQEDVLFSATDSTDLELEGEGAGKTVSADHNCQSPDSNTSLLSSPNRRSLDSDIDQSNIMDSSTKRYRRRKTMSDFHVGLAFDAILCKRKISSESDSESKSIVTKKRRQTFGVQLNKITAISESPENQLKAPPTVTATLESSIVLKRPRGRPRKKKNYPVAQLSVATTELSEKSKEVLTSPTKVVMETRDEDLEINPGKEGKNSPEEDIARHTEKFIKNSKDVITSPGKVRKKSLEEDIDLHVTQLIEKSKKITGSPRKVGKKNSVEDIASHTKKLMEKYQKVVEKEFASILNAPEDDAAFDEFDSAPEKRGKADLKKNGKKKPARNVSKDAEIKTTGKGNKCSKKLDSILLESKSAKKSKKDRINAVDSKEDASESNASLSKKAKKEKAEEIEDDCPSKKTYRRKSKKNVSYCEMELHELKSSITKADIMRSSLSMVDKDRLIAELLSNDGLSDSDEAASNSKKKKPSIGKKRKLGDSISEISLCNSLNFSEISGTSLNNEKKNGGKKEKSIVGKKDKIVGGKRDKRLDRTEKNLYPLKKKAKTSDSVDLNKKRSHKKKPTIQQDKGLDFKLVKDNHSTHESCKTVEEKPQKRKYERKKNQDDKVKTKVKTPKQKFAEIKSKSGALVDKIAEDSDSNELFKNTGSVDANASSIPSIESRKISHRLDALETLSNNSEPVDEEGGKSKKESICVVCELGEGLIFCNGVCLSSFHPDCLGLSTVPEKYYCDECLTGNHSCFLCKETGNLRKCNQAACGKFYHNECALKMRASKFEGNKLHCPLHYCGTCSTEKESASSSKKKLVRCVRCPTAYHGTTCLVAGCVLLNSSLMVCHKHFVPNKNKAHHTHYNVSWCFVCSSGGMLVCCDTCPAAFHPGCVEGFDGVPEEAWQCNSCRTGKKPLYGDLVWVKYGFWRWWPAKVCFPDEIPVRIQKLAHDVGEFPVMFFGSRDYCWLHSGRVFPYQEGDKGCKSAKSNGTAKVFQKALNEVEEAHKELQDIKDKQMEQKLARQSKKPPTYKHIKCNRYITAARTIMDPSEIAHCECRSTADNPCGPGSECLNRMLQIECDKTCPAGDVCQNQRFQKCQHVDCFPIKTSGCGWGLQTRQDIKEGDFVIEYVGELIDEITCRKRINDYHDNGIIDYYFLVIDKDCIIDAYPKGNQSRFMNHSCDPNCDTQKWTVNGEIRVGLFANKDIPASSELTFNYNLDTLGNEKKACRCGSKNCSGFLGLRPKTQNALALKEKKKMKPKKKKKKDKPQTIRHEDDCFLCGDGGELIMCDKPSCSKCYHLKCLTLSGMPRGKWECPWHFCDICGKRATLFCHLCPNSFCAAHSEGEIFQMSDGLHVCSDHGDYDLASSLNTSLALDASTPLLVENAIQSEEPSDAGNDLDA